MLTLIIVRCVLFLAAVLMCFSSDVYALGNHGKVYKYQMLLRGSYQGQADYAIVDPKTQRIAINDVIFSFLPCSITENIQLCFYTKIINIAFIYDKRVGVREWQQEGFRFKKSSQSAMFTYLDRQYRGAIVEYKHKSGDGGVFFYDETKGVIAFSFDSGEGNRYMMLSESTCGLAASDECSSVIEISK